MIELNVLRDDEQSGKKRKQIQTFIMQSSTQNPASRWMHTTNLSDKLGSKTQVVLFGEAISEYV